MKIGIAGAGIVGSYLAYSLSPDNQVDIFDRQSQETLGESCAWGTSKRTVEKYARKLEENTGKYIRHVSNEFISDIYANVDSVTFDKRSLIHDFLQQSQSNFFPGKELNRSEVDAYDLVVDATGPYRSLLPQSKSNLTQNWIVPCFQLVVDSTDLPDDLMFNKRGTGYLWVFPQAEGRARVGCGSFDLNPKQEVNSYLSGKDYKEIKRQGAMVRLIPPSRSLPFVTRGDSFIFGVGESVGTVSPISAEGITSSLICSELFLDSLGESSSLKQAGQIYRTKVLEEFKWIDSQFEFIRAVRFKSKLSQLWRLANLAVPDYASGRVAKLNMLQYGFRS